MKLYNHLFKSQNEFYFFIEENEIPNTNQVLVQVFVSEKNDSETHAVMAVIDEILSDASVICTTTAGNIGEGLIIDDSIVLSISVFNNTTTKTFSFKGLKPEDIVQRLSMQISNRTKLALIYANTYLINSNELLKLVTRLFPNLVIAGGNAGDGMRFQQCTVCCEGSFDDDLVIALLESDVLQVDTNYQMNLQEIGAEFTATKSQGNVVYEINGEPALKVYKKYFGIETDDNPLVYLNSFPLIFTKVTVDIARDPIAVVRESGAVIYAGDVPQGTTFRFGFANSQHIEVANQRDLVNKFEFRYEAAYIFSCAARREIIGVSLNSELRYLNKIAPTSGFITYGEFFHDTENHTNSLLNATTTYVVLSESSPSKRLSFAFEPLTENRESIRLKKLSNFIAQTGRELDETIHYLKQFKQCVDQATILSTTDTSGLISSVNDNFLQISGYKEKEVVGREHCDFIHSDAPENMLEEVTLALSEGKSWKGMVKNRKKDGSAYYVLAETSPIYSKDGACREYLTIRNDVTELQEYREILENRLDSTTTTLKEKIHYSSQYEDAVNSSIAIVKSDASHVITYVNKKMCELSGYHFDELIGLESAQYIGEEFCKSGAWDEVKAQLSEKKRVQNISVNITKSGEEYTVSNLFVPIVDVNGNVIEYLTLMSDITDVIKLNAEMLETQKEVVYTLGAIAETRSKETGLHVRRVAEYSYLLAKLYGLSEHDAEILKQASPMHDIGKVGIPDAILNKPGKLTYEEFEVIKTHAELGYEMLKHSSREILKASAVVAYEHHEKWDGSGYPRGLKGEKIHVFGRITAVADVFDALGHERVYKEAWDIQSILSLFKRERGKHFDPVLIDLFLANLDAFLEIKYTLR